MLRYTQHDTILRATVRLRDGVIPSVERDPAQVSCSKFAESTARFFATLKMPLHTKPYTLNPTH